MITIAKMTNMPNYKQVLETMIEGVRKNRCRSLNDDDIAVLLEEVNEEMVRGKIMFQHLMGDTISSDACPVRNSIVEQATAVRKSDDTEPCISCGEPKKDHNFEEMSDCEWNMTGECPNENTDWRDMR
jgi:hypothetical protein